MTTQTDKVKEEFAKRLHQGMDSAGYPIRGRARILSRQFNISDKGASKWLNGDAIPETSKIPLLATFLNVNAEWLLSGKGVKSILINKDNFQDNKSENKLIPIISWTEAKFWSSQGSITEVEEWLPLSSKCESHCFGLIVTGESMSPRFEPNDRIYINPDFPRKKLKTGDLVIASNKDDDEVIFKKIVFETNGIYLESLNPKWRDKVIELNEKILIIGKVIGLYRNL